MKLRGFKKQSSIERKTVTFKDWRKIVESVNTLNENKIHEYLSEIGLDKNIGLDVYDANYIFIEIKNIDFKFDSYSEFLVNSTWFRPGLFRPDKFGLVFLNCDFSYKNGEAEFVLESPTGVKLFDSVQFIECQMNLIILKVSNAEDIILKKSKINIVDTVRKNSSLFISECSISELKISEGLKILEISKSKFDSFFTDNIIVKNELINFYFDDKSYITGSNNVNTYRKLQSLIRKDVLYNKIQHHILYTKELEAFTAGNNSSDDKILYKINKLLNNHGRSILLPTLWLFVVNFYFVFWFNLSISDIYYNSNFSWYGFCVDTVLMSLDVSPLNKFQHELPQNLIGLDGLRRILLAVISYSIISSALRFKFKS